jgi:hypothetical protein
VQNKQKEEKRLVENTSCAPIPTYHCHQQYIGIDSVRLILTKISSHPQKLALLLISCHGGGRIG